VIFLGWLIGLGLGAGLAVAVLVALSLPLPPILLPLGPILGGIPLLVLVLLVVLIYLAGYALATLSLTPVLPALTFPLSAPVLPAGGVSVAIAPPPGERFGRGMSVGMTAGLNSVFLLLVPIHGFLLSTWALVIVSLGIVTPLARSGIYQGFLGWTGWLLPVSYLATLVGLVLFLINAPVALAGAGLGAFRLDFTTGVVESSGGLLGIPALVGPFTGGFSLGNFNFLTSTGLQDSFVGRGLSSHETGHTLNTAAFGGVVLWINAIDENILPSRMNLAYGELVAESHAQGLPPIAGTSRTDFFVRVWG
jgi:hypothetical protein